MTQPSIIQNYLLLFQAFVKSHGFEGAIRKGAELFPNELPAVRHEYEKSVETIKSLSRGALRKKRMADWYGGPTETDFHWPRLKRYLLEKKLWDEKTVEAIDAESTRVMSNLPHVGGTVQCKGLVVGYVQSGKTANYTALIAKAADVGYRLVIVLAGIHNGLRRQTQKRLQEELIDTDPELRETWHTLTYADSDFSAKGMNPDSVFGRYASDQRILLVVKKNVHVLKRLVQWLGKGSSLLRENCPTLIIDDEADQAGINTGKSEEQRSATNRKILELIGSLPKHAYVGYTATPFANVLVDPSGSDLYPEDFIVALEKPKGYFGAELFSGREPLADEDDETVPPPDLFRPVPTEELEELRPASPRNKDDRVDFFPHITPSLAASIRYFLMATAARWVRGHRFKHSSMLIHTSLYVDMHEKLLDVVKLELKKCRNEIGDSAVRRAWNDQWDDEMSRVEPHAKGTVPFEALKEHLIGVIDHLEAVADNGSSETRLLYDDEDAIDENSKVVHIAVGGNTLSRGLTLEGLVVSYFLRSASAYDTLLQMGRWFGYRFGYEDLPRLWMTEELQSSFHDLATVEEEVRQDIARYASEFVTPLEFAVRIREYPGLTVTSRLKMRHARKARVNYGGFTRQTTFFENKNSKLLVGNWRAGGRLLDTLSSLHGAPREDRSHTYFTGVAYGLVLEFLDEYEFHPDHVELQPHLLKNYIEAQVAKGRCDKWTVAVVSRTKEHGQLGHAALGNTSRTFNLVNRAKRSDRGQGVDVGTITTQQNFGFDISNLPKPADVKKQPRRPVGTPPLLLLYPISKDSSPMRPTSGKAREPLGAVHHILGVAIAFPETPGGSEHDYVEVQLPEPDVFIEEEEVFVDEDDG